MEGHAILFPGQGAQYVGMAKDLALRSPLARAIFSKAEEILGFDLLQVCVDGPAEKLNSTAMSQPAIFVSSLAALEEAKSSNPEIVSKCTATAGLSLGEYTALVFADAISYPDGLRLVAERGRAMQESAEARPSTMASILLLDKEKVQELCDTVSMAGPKVTIANHLCPGNLVVSGAVSAVEETEKLAQATGGKTIRLTVAGAFHTQFMEPAQERLRKALENTEIRTPRVPVWSNVTGKKHEILPKSGNCYPAKLLNRCYGTNWFKISLAKISQVFTRLARVKYWQVFSSESTARHPAMEFRPEHKLRHFLLFHCRIRK